MRRDVYHPCGMQDSIERELIIRHAPTETGEGEENYGTNTCSGFGNDR